MEVYRKTLPKKWNVKIFANVINGRKWVEIKSLVWYKKISILKYYFIKIMSYLW